METNPGPDSAASVTFQGSRLKSSKYVSLAAEAGASPVCVVDVGIWADGVKFSCFFLHSVLALECKRLAAGLPRPLERYSVGARTLQELGDIADAHRRAGGGESSLGRAAANLRADHADWLLQHLDRARLPR